jgi:3,4-dihydroxy 2-butanone 4-phosphate synthase
MTMKEATLSGTSRERTAAAIESLRRGGGVLVVDDADRENEADVIFPAESIAEAQMALLIRECSGIVCLCLTDEHVKRLALPMMVESNTSPYQTGFTVSIDAVGCATGVAAAERVRTVRAAVAPDARPEHLARPGHIFPLLSRPGGVLERRGHTEATVDLMRLAGLQPSGVLCELMNPDGTMARGPQARVFAAGHDLPLLSVEDVVAYQRAQAEVGKGARQGGVSALSAIHGGQTRSL